MRPFCLGLLFLFFLGACSPQQATAPASVLPGPAVKPSVQPIADSVSRPESSPTPRPFPHSSVPPPEFGAPTLPDTQTSSQLDPVIRGGGSSRTSNGVGTPIQPAPSPTPLFYIADVRLANTGASVMGSQPPGQIQADYSGDAVELLISGHFGAAAPNDFAFTYPADVQYQTFIATPALTARVLLNDSLLLEVLAANSQQLRVRLPRQKLTDLYILGSHKLSIEHAQYYADVLIRVDDPAYTADLLPRIHAVEVLLDAQDQPQRLKVVGEHLPINPRFFHTTLNGDFAFGHQTRVLTDGSWEAEIYLPDPAKFLTDGPDYELRFSTPFGTTLKTFTWAAL